jgi:hypothetical protein
MLLRGSKSTQMTSLGQATEAKEHRYPAVSGVLSKQYIILHVSLDSFCPDHHLILSILWQQQQQIQPAL